ncbi:MAG TPA: hypothetical protein VGC13_25200 [Longimicrobium sp.]
MQISFNSNIGPVQMILNNRIVACEGEMVVRSYKCGVYKSLFLGTKADGVVEVTNRRILFKASDSADENRNTLYSEIPISEVSGLSLFKGLSFSIVAFLAGLIVSGLLVYAASQILSGLTREHATSGLLKFVLWAIAIGAAYQAYRDRVKPFRGLMFNALAIALFTLIAQYATMSYDGRGKGTLPLLAGLLLMGFQLYLVFRLARRNTIDFHLFSRSTQPSPVAISGFSAFDARISEITRTMTSFAPGEDATRMMNELGAVISDIQSMGDFGIEKWARTGQVGNTNQTEER